MQQIEINKRKEIVKNIITYILAAMISLAVICFSVKIWAIDIYVPIQYGGDTSWTAATIRNFINGGDIYHYVDLGMPFDGTDRVIYPMTAYIPFGILKLMSFFSSSYGLILNVYAIGTFPLTAIITVFAFRQLRISRVISCMGAVLYSVLVYHFFRFEGHLYIASYFMVPFFCVAAIWIMRGELVKPALNGAAQNKRTRIFGSYDKKKMCFCIFACIGVGFSEAYYSMFALMVLVFVGIYAWVEQKNYRHFVFAFFMIIVVGCVMLPWLLASLGSFSSFAGATRSPGDVEIYGLKLTNLLLPSVNSRIPGFAEIKNSYLAVTPLNNENSYATLGIVGSIGFIYSFFIVLFKKIRKNDKEIEYCGKLNLFLFIVATIGGLGALIVVFFSYAEAARCLNRMSILIAFFSLLTVCYLLQRIQKKITNKGIMSLFLAGVIGVMILGIYDQTPAIPLSSPQRNEAYVQERKYFQQIEEQLSENSKILQLPFISSGIYTDYNDVGAYEPLKPYLFTKKLKFSYGADEGTYEELWLNHLEKEPIDVILEDAVIVGFEGVLIDRYGYVDRDTDLIEKQIAELLKVEPLISEDGRYAFFNLCDYAEEIKRQYSEQEVTQMKKDLLHTVVVGYGEGFFPIEIQSDNSIKRWALENASMQINNQTGEEQKVRLSMDVNTPYDEPYMLTIKVGDISKEFSINKDIKECSLVINVPSGVTIVELASDTPRINADIDSRDIHFMIGNLNLRVEE